MHEALYKLNTVSIGNIRLRVFKAKYSTQNNVPLTRKSLNQIPLRRIKEPEFRESSRDGCTCAKVMAPSSDTINVNLEDSFPTAIWTQFTCILEVRDLSSIPNLFETVFSRQFAFNFIAPIGSNLMVMAFQS